MLHLFYNHFWSYHQTYYHISNIPTSPKRRSLETQSVDDEDELRPFMTTRTISSRKEYARRQNRWLRWSAYLSRYRSKWAPLFPLKSRYKSDSIISNNINNMSDLLDPTLTLDTPPALAALLSLLYLSNSIEDLPLNPMKYLYASVE